MATITMKNTIVRKFGKDSFEAGYIQYLFARRDASWVKSAYDKMMAVDYQARG